MRTHNNKFASLWLLAVLVLAGCNASNDDPKPDSSPQPEGGLRTVQSSGEEREYFLQIPGAVQAAGASLSASAVGAELPPLIIAYHGYTGSYENWVGPKRFYDLIDTVGDEAVFVAPNGLPDASGARAWGGEADLVFFADLLAELDSIGVSYDANKIFVVGHSNGAGFTNEIACRFGDVVRGIAEAAGALVSNDCIGSTAVLMFQGSNDPLTAESIALGTLNYWVLYNGWEPGESVAAEVGPCDDYAAQDKPDNLPYPVLYCRHTQGHDYPDFASATIRDFFAGLPPATQTPEFPAGGGSERATPPRDAWLTFQLDVPVAAGRPLNGAVSLRPVAFIDNPRCAAPDIILNYPFALDGLALPGEVSERITIPITYVDFSGLLEFPSEWALSLTVYVEGGSNTVIPTPQVDYDALVPVTLVDRNTDLNLDSVVTVAPVKDLCGVLPD